MRTFEVIITKNWIERVLDYQAANNHNEIANILEKQSIRVNNVRFREIEKTGEYYRITDMQKGGKSFIYEIISTDLNKHQSK